MPHNQSIALIPFSDNFLRFSSILFNISGECPTCWLNNIYPFPAFALCQFHSPDCRIQSPRKVNICGFSIIMIILFLSCNDQITHFQICSCSMKKRTLAEYCFFAHLFFFLTNSILCPQHFPILRMVLRLITPPGNIKNQFRRNRPVVRKLYRPLTGLVIFQTFGKFPDSLRPRIESHMVFKTGKLDDIMFLPISRHTP